MLSVRTWAPWVLALATAALLILAFPGFSIPWLAPVALAPLLVAAVREESHWRRFLLGLLMGTVYWFVVCFWIQFVLEVHGDMGLIGSWGGFLLFAVADAIPQGLFALAAGPLLRVWCGPPAVAAAWVVMEWARGPFGFTWVKLGDTAIDMAIPLRLAPVTGVYGISFLFALTAAVAAAAVFRRRRQLLWLALLGAPYLLPAIAEQPAGDQKAVLVQPNVRLHDRWTEDEAQTLKRLLLALSTRSALGTASPRASLIVWPEVPAPIYFYQDAPLRAAIETMTRATGAALVTGTVAYTPEGAPLNSAVVIAPSGALVTRYDKNILVPFGEFVPPLFGWVNRISQEIGDFQAGTRIGVAKVEGRSLGVFICYEAVFPSYVRQYSRMGASVLVNISNDGYFGRSAARYQHLQMVRMRAVENGRWILRATNDGITVAVDPSGRIRAKLPPETAGAVAARFSYATGETVFVRWGDWFVWLCAAVVAACLVALLVAWRTRHSGPLP